MTTQTIPHNLKWSELLRSCVNEKGIISKAYSAFHNYSVGNQMLAIRQCIARDIPITPINTFLGWKKLNRRVKKGSRAVWLCMPIPCKFTDTNEKTGEETEHCFQRFVYKKQWFLMSQTKGKRVDKIELPGFDMKQALKTLEVREGKFRHTNGNTQGYARGRTIAVSPLAELPHKTRFHEIGHVMLGHTTEGNMEDSERTPRDIREVEAESVSYILCSVLKLSGAVQSRGYIQHWLQSEAIPEKSAQRIFSAANKILKAGTDKE